MSDDERVLLSVEQATAMLPDSERVHTFRQAGMFIIGADWDKTEIIEHLKQYHPELSGPAATGMKHGIVIEDDRGPLFIETRPNNGLQPTPTGVPIIEAK